MLQPSHSVQSLIPLANITNVPVLTSTNMNGACTIWYVDVWNIKYWTYIVCSEYCSLLDLLNWNICTLFTNVDAFAVMCRYQLVSKQFHWLWISLQWLPNHGNEERLIFSFSHQSEINKIKFLVSFQIIFTYFNN